MLIDHGDNPAPQINPDSHARRAADPERTARLLNYQPRLDSKSVDSVRDVAVDLLLRVRSTTLASDKFMTFTLFHYATYCLNTHGRFEPDLHLGEQYIRPYATRYANDASKSSALSALRRVRSGGVRPLKHSRTKASPPYAPNEWLELRRAAAQWPTTEATLLLTLTGAMGLRPPEVKNARADWVNINADGRVTMTVVSPDGTFRVVPALGKTAYILRRAVEQTDDYLFSGHLVNRNNCVNGLTSRLAKDFKVFEGFTAGRARNTYIAHLLQTNMPFSMVCAVCGIKPGVQLPTDLLPWMTSFTAEQIYDGFDDIRPVVPR